MMNFFEKLFIANPKQIGCISTRYRECFCGEERKKVTSKLTSRSFHSATVGSRLD
jgi:hypothetical protein